MTSNFRSLLALLVSALLLAACETNPALDKAGQATFDGLYPVTDTVMDRVWARDNLDLRRYDKFMIVDAGLKFRPVEETHQTRRGTADEFPLDARQRQVIRDIVNEEFNRALDSVNSMERVDRPGPGTLVVRGAIIDIVSRIPPDAPGRQEYYLDSVGQATFVIELIDSETEATLLRAVDTRAAETPGYTYRSNRVNNAAEVRRLAAHWANQLAEGLQTVETIPELND